MSDEYGFVLPVGEPGSITDEIVSLTPKHAAALVEAAFDADARGEFKPGWTFTLPDEEEVE